MAFGGWEDELRIAGDQLVRIAPPWSRRGWRDTFLFIASPRFVLYIYIAFVISSYIHAAFFYHFTFFHIYFFF